MRVFEFVNILDIYLVHCTQKKFSNKDFFSKYDQIRRKLGKARESFMYLLNVRPHNAKLWLTVFFNALLKALIKIFICLTGRPYSKGLLILKDAVSEGGSIVFWWCFYRLYFNFHCFFYGSSNLFFVTRASFLRYIILKCKYSVTYLIKLYAIFFTRRLIKGWGHRIFEPLAEGDGRSA